VQWLLPFLVLAPSPDEPALAFSAAKPEYAAASAEYRQLWCTEGSRIMAAMERVTGFPYPAGTVEVAVVSGTPMTAFGGRSMSLKARYPLYYKRATLVHELGHRLAFTMPRTAGLDDHRLLYLFLYDVWFDLYGAEYADTMVAIERRITGRYDYAGAWGWALGLTRAERQARLAALRAQGATPATPSGPRTASPSLPGCA